MAKIGSHPVSVLDDPVLGASRVVTAREAAKILGIGLTKLYDILGSRAISSYKDGYSRRIFYYSLLEYQAARANEGTQLGAGGGKLHWLKRRGRKAAA